MRSLLAQLWADESGVIVSSELVILGTLGVVGTTVGLNMVTTAVNEEFKDLAFGIRSLNQSSSVCGFSSCRAFTAGSAYTQQPVQESLAALGAGYATRAPLDPGVAIPTTLPDATAVPKREN